MKCRKISTCCWVRKKSKFTYLRTLQCFYVEKNSSLYQICQEILSAFFPFWIVFWCCFSHDHSLNRCFYGYSVISSQNPAAEKPDFGISISQDSLDVLLQYRWIFTNQLPESFTKLVGEVEWKTYLGIESRVLKNGIVGNRQNELLIHLLIREGSSEINSILLCFPPVGPWHASCYYAFIFITNKAVDSLGSLFFLFYSGGRNKTNVSLELNLWVYPRK